MLSKTALRKDYNPLDDSNSKASILQDLQCGIVQVVLFLTKARYYDQDNILSLRKRVSRQYLVNTVDKRAGIKTVLTDRVPLYQG